jgi:Mlc titration factor MtfA (ptsG expression regulator)
MFEAYRQWQRSRIIARTPVDDALWRQTLARVPFLAGLTEDERKRLRDTAALFLHAKAIHGAAGLTVDPAMGLTIAAQACLLILNLDIDYYRGWVEVIVYPAAFVPRHSYIDPSGVVHALAEARSGEAWLRGPVILSWEDIATAQLDDAQVVIHEFAHKLDMLNGSANGYPPLHRGMSRMDWAQAWQQAYSDFGARVERGEFVEIDDYGAESPGEFFAVMSEAFFALPHRVSTLYPRVYTELCKFYRQDPVRRMPFDSRA